MDQSNRLPDDIAYLEMTVSESIAGAVDIIVEPLSPVLVGDSDNFGIKTFGFNLAPGVETASLDVTGLPEGWKVKFARRVEGFSDPFDVVLKGPRAMAVPVLDVSISGLALSDIEGSNFAAAAAADDSSMVAAARVLGLDLENDSRRVRVASFAAVDVTPVPLPATIWLLGAAVGLVGALRGYRHASWREDQE
jgi:hypothetical protein